MAACNRLHHIGNAEQLFEAFALELGHRQQLGAAVGRHALGQRALLLLRIVASGFAQQDFRDELLRHIWHGAGFARGLGQQPGIQCAAAHAQTFGERVARQIQTAHCVAKKILLAVHGLTPVQW